MSQRFYCPAPPVDGLFRLDSDESRHLARVCRHEAGDLVEIFDGQGYATNARIQTVLKDAVTLTAEGSPIPDRAAACRIEIGTAVPKGDRFDWLMEKAVEAGVARITPLSTERSVVDPRRSKLDRLRRAIVEASKQSGRNRLMELSAPETLSTFLSRREGLRLVADPEGAAFEAWPLIPTGGLIRLVVGPEGGLSPAESAEARELGWTPVRLTEPILRIETAVLVGAAAVLAIARPQLVH